MKAPTRRESPASKKGRVELSFNLREVQRVTVGMTIGDLARAAGVPTSTVRYYERAGLLRPRARSASNYRLYSAEDLHRLRFIRAAQATGFTLEDITHLLRPAFCHRVQKLIGDRLGQVEARMKELRHVRRVLRQSLEQCRAHEETGRCEVVAELSTRAKRP
jgi:MerR family mercuric resistance operon transcriptional regulator